VKKMSADGFPMAFAPLRALLHALFLIVNALIERTLTVIHSRCSLLSLYSVASTIAWLICVSSSLHV